MSRTPISRPRGSFLVLIVMVIVMAVVFFNPGQRTSFAQHASKRPVAEQKMLTSAQRAAALEAELRAEPGPYIGNWHELERLDQADRLKWLVEHHPHEDVNTFLADVVYSARVNMHSQILPPLSEFIRQRQILVIPSVNAGAWASFSVVPLQSGVNNSTPTMSIDPELMTRLATKKGVLDAMLTLYHETQHVKFFFDHPDDRSSYALPATETISPEICTQAWHEEIATHTMECALAIEWEMTVNGVDRNDLNCSSPAALARSYYEINAKNADLGLTTDAFGDCAAVYKRLAEEAQLVDTP